MRILSDEEKDRIGRDKIKEVEYYYCDYCRHNHSKIGSQYYTAHLPFRNVNKGIMICTVLKGGM